MPGFIRDRSGTFVAAVKVVSIRKHFLRCVLHMLCELSSSKMTYSCLKIANNEASSFGRGCDVEWSVFQVKRQLAKRLGRVEVYTPPLY